MWLIQLNSPMNCTHQNAPNVFCKNRRLTDNLLAKLNAQTRQKNRPQLENLGVLLRQIRKEQNYENH